MNSGVVDQDLLRGLYGTGETSQKWPELLDRLHPLCNASSAGLAVIENSADLQGQLQPFNCFSTNIDLDAQRYYADNYTHHEIDHYKLCVAAPVGEMVHDPAFDDVEKIRLRPDVAWANENLGIFHRVGVRLNDDVAWTDLMAFQYAPERLTSATIEEFAQVKSYMPHIGEAISKGRIFDAIRKRYQAVLSMLDKVNVGMLLLRSDGMIVIANSFARQVIEESSRLSVTGNGGLAATSKNEGADLKAKLQLMAKNPELLAKQYVRLGTDLESNDLVIELSNVVDDDGEVGTDFQGIIAIIVDPNRPISLGFESLSSIYSLTPSESELANMIANGLDYATAAEHRSVGRETIKSQARTLMRKLHTDSRAGVVRRMLSLGIPFVD